MKIFISTIKKKTEGASNFRVEVYLARKHVTCARNMQKYRKYSKYVAVIGIFTKARINFFIIVRTKIRACINIRDQFCTNNFYFEKINF